MPDFQKLYDMLEGGTPSDAKVDRRDPQPTTPLQDNLHWYITASSAPLQERLGGLVSALDTADMTGDDILMVVANSAADVTGNVNYRRIPESPAAHLVKRAAAQKLKAVLSDPNIAALPPEKRSRLMASTTLAALTEQVALPEALTDEAAISSFDNIVESQLAQALRDAETGQVQGDPVAKARYEQILNFGTYLRQRTPAEKAAYVKRTVKGQLGAEVYNTLGMPEPSYLRSFEQTDDAMSKMLGQEVNRYAHVNARFAQAQNLIKRRELGFTAGDPTRPGADIPDPAAPTGFSPFEFMGKDDRKAFIDAAVPQNITPAEQLMIMSKYDMTSEEANRAILAARAELTNKAMVAATGAAAEAGQEPLGPLARSSIGYAGSNLLAANALMGSVMDTINSKMDQLDDRTRGTFLETVAKAVGTAATGDGKAGAETRGIADAMSVAMNLAVFPEIFAPTPGRMQQEFRERVGWNKLSGPEQRAMQEQAVGLIDNMRRGLAKMGENSAEMDRRFWESYATRGKSGMGLWERMAHIPIYTLRKMTEGLGESIAGVVERPQWFPLVMAGEKLGDVTMGAAIQAGDSVTVVGGLMRQARLGNVLRQAGRFSPTYVDNVVSGLRRAVDNVDQVGLHSQMTKAIARGEALLKLHREGQGVWSPELAQATNAFASSARKVIPKLDGGDFDFVSDLNRLTDMASTPSTMDWKGLRDMWRDWRGKIPTSQIKAEASRILGEMRGKLPERLGQQLVGREVAGDDVMKLRQDYRNAVQSGDTAKIDAAIKAMDDAGVAKYGAPKDVLDRLNNFDQLVRKSKALRGQTGPEAEAARVELQARAKELVGGELLDDLSSAELKIMSDVHRSKAGQFFDKVGQWVFDKTGLRMYSQTGSMAKHATLADQFYDYSNRTAMGVYEVKALDNLRKLRLEAIYHYAESKLQQSLDELVVARELNDIHGLPTQAERLALEKAIPDQIARLRAEAREAFARPIEKRWNYRTKDVAQYVSAGEIADLAGDMPTLFSSLDADKLVRQLSRQTEAGRATLKTLFARRRALKRDLASLRKVRQEMMEFGRADRDADMRRVEETLQGDPTGEQISNKLDEMANELRIIDRMLSVEERLRTGKMTNMTEAQLLQHARDVKTSYKLAMAQGVQAGVVTPEYAQVVGDIVDALPDKYFFNKLQLEFISGAPKGMLAGYSVFDQAIQLYIDAASGKLATTDPYAFAHEYGHHLVAMVIDWPDVQQLWKIFEKAELTDRTLALGQGPSSHVQALRYIEQYVNAPNAAARLDYLSRLTKRGPAFDAMQSYWNQFTEWYARGFGNSMMEHLYKKAASDPAADAVYSRAMLKGMRTLDEVEADLRKDGLLAPDVGFADFFRRVLAGDVGVREETILPTRAKGLKPATDKGFYDVSDWASAVDNSIVPWAGQDTLFKKWLGEVGITVDPVTDYIYGVRKKGLDLKGVQSERARIQDRLWKIDDWAKRLEGNTSQVALAEQTDKAIRAELNRTVLGKESEARVYQSVTRRSMEKALAEPYKEMRATLQRLKGRHVVPVAADVMTLGAMSFWDQTRVVRGMARAAELQIGAVATRLEDLTSALHGMDPETRFLLKRVMEAGIHASPELLTRIAEVDPRAARMLERATQRGTALDQITKNINEWLNEDSRLQARLLETAHEAGFLSDFLYEDLLKRGYSPHLYGIFERPKLMKGKFTREARRALKSGGKGAPGTVVKGMDASELMFARDLNKFRIRFQDSDGFIYDRTFTTQDAAMNWVNKEFGAHSWAALPDGMWQAETSYGAKIKMAAPIGPERAEALDLLTGTVRKSKKGKWVKDEPSPQARLERFAQLNRDLHVHAMLSNLKQFGLVLSEGEFHRVALARAGRTSLKGLAPFAGDYIQLPEDRYRFGDMSGHFVHRRVLQEVNTMHHSYDQLRVWLTSLQDFWAQRGINPLAEASTNLFQRIANMSMDSGVGRVIKTTQILFNQAAVSANFISNILFSSLADGSLVTRARNWDSFKLAAKEIFGETGLDKSPLYYEAVKNGILNAGLFDRSRNPMLRKAFLNLAKLQDAKALEARLEKLQSMLGEKVRRQDFGGRTREIEMEIASIEDALQHADRGWAKRIFDWVMGFGLKESDAMGLPNNALVEHAKSFYGRIDDFWKYATYVNLRKRLSPAQAAWRVKSFMQDYANVPAAVQASGRSPFGALVPSFAYEMSRIMTNAIRYAPVRLAGIFGSMAMLNSFSAYTAGVDEDRLEAMEASMGQRDWLSRTIARMTSIRVFDPFTHELLTNIDLSDAAAPLFNFTDSYSALSRMTDQLMPPEERTGLQSALAAGLKYAGNFVGARPLLGWGAAMATGRDPLTNRPLMDQDLEKRTAWDWTRSIWHVVGRSLIPPAMPGGRQFSDVWNQVDRPIDPTSGRPLAGASGGGLGYNIINALTNIKVRGGPAAILSQALGGKDRLQAVTDDDLIKMLMWRVRQGKQQFGAEIPMYGARADQRELWARWANEAKPEQKAAYWKQLKDSLDKEDKYVVQSKTYARNRDDYQMMLAMRAMEEKGTAGTFDKLDPFQQTVVLLHMDLANVRQEAFNELIKVMTTSGAKLQYERVANPAVLRDSIREIGQYLKEHPGSESRFKPVLEWMTWAQWKAWKNEDKARRWAQEING